MKKVLQLSVLALLAVALTSGVALVHHSKSTVQANVAKSGIPPPPCPPCGSTPKTPK